MIRLVPVEPQRSGHVKVLYYLLEQRQPQECISHRTMPSFAEHAKFVKSEPYLAWYLVFENRDVLGATYLSKQREIGIFLFASAQGQGFGKAAIELLMERHPGDFYANINPLNTASQRLFQRMGFGHIQQTYLLRGPQNDRTET